MDLNFEIYSIVLLVLAILVVGNFLRDGESNYLEGALLVVSSLLNPQCILENSFSIDILCIDYSGARDGLPHYYSDHMVLSQPRRHHRQWPRHLRKEFHEFTKLQAKSYRILSDLPLYLAQRSALEMKWFFISHVSVSFHRFHQPCQYAVRLIHIGRRWGLHCAHQPPHTTFPARQSLAQCARRMGG